MAVRDQATRQRILEHAAALFADRGFKKVTVREICRAARANVAAVNYHFGDKLGLYRAVVRNAVAAMRETNELSVEAGRGAGPEDQLRAYVRVFLSRIIGSGPHSWIHKLMTREIEDPTEAFDEVIRDVIEPRHRYLSGIVASLSSLPVDDLRVTRAVASIQGQCFLFARPLPRKLPASWRAGLRDLDGTIDHVTAFSLAGIRGMKNGRREGTKSRR
jgi:TetR/AcrR family transcriptional regulator, regulator of cefoperazone and chloramphenicol sensitivity